jgi:hypothetical protein
LAEKVGDFLVLFPHLILFRSFLELSWSARCPHSSRFRSRRY